MQYNAQRKNYLHVWLWHGYSCHLVLLYCNHNKCKNFLHHQWTVILFQIPNFSYSIITTMAIKCKNFMKTLKCSWYLHLHNKMTTFASAFKPSCHFFVLVRVVLLTISHSPQEGSYFCHIQSLISKRYWLTGNYTSLNYIYSKDYFAILYFMFRSERSWGNYCFWMANTYKTIKL